MEKFSIIARGVPDQDFQNPAGTGFTEVFHEIRPNNPVLFGDNLSETGHFYIENFSLVIQGYEEQRKRKDNMFKETSNSLAGSCC